jgi:drug/metabolite transporter (DMT)-like permease
MPSFDKAERSRRVGSLLQIHLAVFLFGFPGLFGKWLPLPPHLIVFGRVVFATLALALVIGFSGRSLRLAAASDMRLLVLCGFILSAHWTMFFKSVQVSTVAVALLSYSSFPVFTAFLEPMAFKERWDPWSVVLALLTAAGVFLIVPRGGLASPALLGVGWGLGAGLTFAVLSLINRRLAGTNPSLIVAFYQDLWAAVFLLPLAFLAGPRFSGRDLGLLALLGVFGTAGAHTLFINGMKRIPARTASIISSLEPVYGIVLAFFFLKESPALRTVLGGAMILAAALGVTLKAHRRP